MSWCGLPGLLGCHDVIRQELLGGSACDLSKVLGFATVWSIKICTAVEGAWCIKGCFATFWVTVWSVQGFETRHAAVPGCVAD